MVHGRAFSWTLEARPCIMEVDSPPQFQPLVGVAPPPTLPPWAGLGNISSGVPADIVSGGWAAIPAPPPLPELQYSLEYMPARDLSDASRESQSPFPLQNTSNSRFVADSPAKSCVWQKVKPATITRGDYEGVELIDVSMSEGWVPEDGTLGAYPVIRGMGANPEEYSPFQWPLVSELH